MAKMSTVLLVIVLLMQQLVSADAQLDELWTLFKETYNKSYTDVDEAHRRSVWENKIEFITKHNLENDLGLNDFIVGLNEFIEWTDDEVNEFLFGTKIIVDPDNDDEWEADSERDSADLTAAPVASTLPDSVDWRAQNYVTPVKNQGRCGSCWSFSATGALEAQNAKKTGRLVSLSEQNLVDCSQRQGNGGCHGGGITGAFKYVQVNGGIDTEASYPYVAQNGKCRYNQSNVGAECTSFRKVRKSEQALKAAVAKVGPVSVAIDVTTAFLHYKRGIFYDRNCSSTRLDHAVLVVGYGSYSGKDYWIVKNSWGVGWGEHGYIRMARNRGNNCGIVTRAAYPLV